MPKELSMMPQGSAANKTDGTATRFEPTWSNIREDSQQGRGPIETMTTKRKMKLPAWAVILDVLGAFMLAAGIILLNGGAGLVDVSSTEVRGPAIALIVMGVLLMMPMIAVIVLKARSPR